jgi:hypothetical protein
MKLIVALLFAVFSISTIQAQNNATQMTDGEIVGKWKASYAENQLTKTLTIEITSENGKLVCAVDMPDQGLYHAGFDVRVCEAKDFHLSRKAIDQTYNFVVKPEGNSLSVKYKLGDTCGGKMQEIMAIKVE